MTLMTYEAFVELVARMRLHQQSGDTPTTLVHLERSVDNAIDAHREARLRLFSDDLLDAVTLPIRGGGRTHGEPTSRP